ncbi:MAG: FAD-binding protein [Anaerorhabdus sp.]
MIKAKIEEGYDVIVVGAGLAGIQATYHAAINGARVLMVTCSHIFSGSSFYPKTWGLGLVSANDCDKEEFVSLINQVGCNMNDKSLVEKLVNTTDDILNDFKYLGIPLKHAINSKQQEFIPCFDNKTRIWHGLEKSGIKASYLKLLDRDNIDTFDNTTVVDIQIIDNKVKGVVLVHKGNLIVIPCKAVVFAGGGMGNLYRDSLNTKDSTGLLQYLAMKHGSKLINLEFQQMMYGYKGKTLNTIYNEKIFKYTEFTSDGSLLFNDVDKALLEKRSLYGPFTSRLDSKVIDFKICGALNENKRVFAKYQDDLFSSDSEFIKVYFDWLEKSENIIVKEPFEIGIFYHASNGGIHIKEDTSCEIHGLFASGEVCGGISGADRIGGLASATALVFGKIAGISASSYIKNEKLCKLDYVVDSCVENAGKYIKEIQALASKYLMVIKSEKSLLEGLENLKNISKKLTYTNKFDMDKYLESSKLNALIALSFAKFQAALMRKESRGSHFRSDYPIEDKAYQKRIVSYMLDNRVYSEWEIKI